MSKKLKVAQLLTAHLISISTCKKLCQSSIQVISKPIKPTYYKFILHNLLLLQSTSFALAVVPLKSDCQELLKLQEILQKSKILAYRIMTLSFKWVNQVSFTWGQNFVMSHPTNDRFHIMFHYLFTALQTLDKLLFIPPLYIS